MLKNCLYYSSFLILFLSLIFVTNAQELVFKSVSVVETINGERIKVSWLFVEIESDSISIHKCVENCDGDDSNRKFELCARVAMTDLEWIDEDEVPPLVQNYYRLSYHKDGMTPTHSNMVLKVVQFLAEDSCQNAVSLSWNPIEILDEVKHYNVIWKKIVDDNIVSTAQISTEDTYFTVELLEPNSDYKFVVQAVSNNDTIDAFSNSVSCKTQTERVAPYTVAISNISVLDDNTIRIIVETDSIDEPSKFNLLNLHRYEGENMVSKIVGSLPYRYDNIYTFSDSTAIPQQKIYYYYAVAKHRCKPDDISDTLTNIHLSGGRNVGDEEIIDTISFCHWGSGDIFLLISYDLWINDSLYRKDIEANTRYYIDIDQFMSNSNTVKYQVKANYELETWLSNRLVLYHKLIVKFPSAFNPNGGREENRTFYPLLDYPLVDNYRFIIYNRWGQEVFSTSTPPKCKDCSKCSDCANYEARWNGTFKGRDCPTGIYAYKIVFSYNEGKERYADSGSVFLVR